MNDISSYFSPLNKGLYSVKDRWHFSQFGYQIDSHVESYFPDLNNVDIAFFNVPEYEGTDNVSRSSDCKIRDSLYRLYFESLPKIADLGVLHIESRRKDTFKIIETVILGLMNQGILPVIIGGGHDISYAVYKAYASADQTINLCCVDSSFNIGLQDDKLTANSFFSKILSHKPSYLFNYINLGYQTFFVKPDEVQLLNNLHFEINRLGYIQNNMHEIEPFLRNTDFLSFDMSALSSSSFMSNVYSTPNGIHGQEACQIFRYAGISDKITCIGIFEYNDALDSHNQGAQLIAQMVWYFLEGFKSRKNELNPNLDQCVKYTVAFKDNETQIDFYKSQSSGRWWMGVPLPSENNHSDNYFVACSYQDYERANKGEIPQRWLKTYNRFL